MLECRSAITQRSYYSFDLLTIRVVRFLLSVIAAVRLIPENLCLWQQLLVLLPGRPQPCLSNADRRFWISVSR
jgi:hypothetical protein